MLSAQARFADMLGWMESASYGERDIGALHHFSLIVTHRCM